MLPVGGACGLQTGHADFADQRLHIAHAERQKTKRLAVFRTLGDGLTHLDLLERARRHGHGPLHEGRACQLQLHHIVEQGFQRLPLDGKPALPQALAQHRPPVVARLIELAQHGQHLVDLRLEFQRMHQRFGRRRSQPLQTAAAFCIFEFVLGQQSLLPLANIGNRRKLGRAQQLFAEQAKVRAQTTTRVAQHRALFFAQRRRMFGAQRERIGKPAVGRFAIDHQLRHRLGAHGHAIDLDGSELLARDFVDAAVDVGQPRMGLRDLAAKLGDQRFGLRGLQLRDAMRDGFDGGLKLPHALAVARQQRHGQRAHVFGNLAAQHGQRGLALGRHQHLATRREKVADDVGDGVRLAGARRALHDHAIGALELLDDGDLLLVVGQRKVQLTRGLGAACARPRVARHAAKTQRLNLACLVAWRRHQHQRGAGQIVGLGDALLQTLNVLMQIIAGLGARKKHGRIRYDKLVLDRRIGLQIRVIGAAFMQIARDKTRDRFVACGLERRQHLAAFDQQLARAVFDVGGQRHIAVGQRVEFKARTHRGTRTHLDGQRHCIDGNLDRLREQRILIIHTAMALARELPRRNRHAPYHLDGLEAGLQFHLRLERKQLAVERNRFASLGLFIGPGLPQRQIVLQHRLGLVGHGVEFALDEHALFDQPPVLLLAQGVQRLDALFIETRHRPARLLRDIQIVLMMQITDRWRRNRHQPLHTQPDRAFLIFGVQLHTGQLRQFVLPDDEILAALKFETARVNVLVLLQYVRQQVAELLFCLGHLPHLR